MILKVIAIDFFREVGVGFGPLGRALALLAVVFVIRSSTCGSSASPVQLTSTCRTTECSYRVRPTSSPWYHTGTLWCLSRAPSSRFSDFLANADRRSRTVKFLLSRREEDILLRCRSEQDWNSVRVCLSQKA